MKAFITAIACLILLASCDSKKADEINSSDKKSDFKIAMKCQGSERAKSVFAASSESISINDRLAAIQFINGDCMRKESTEADRKKMVSLIANGLDLQEFSELYKNLNGMNSEMRSLLIENATALDKSGTPRILETRNYRLGTIETVAKPIDNQSVNLESMGRPYPGSASVTTATGKQLIFLISNQFGNHAGFTSIQFWDEKSGKLIKYAPTFRDQALKDSILLKHWKEGSELRNSYSMLIDSQNNLYAILVATERESLNESTSGTPSVTCLVDVVRYTIDSEIQVENLGEYECKKSAFSNDNDLIDELLTAIDASVGNNKRLPVAAYRLFDSRRLDDADIALIKHLSKMDGFDAALFADLVNREFAESRKLSGKSFDDYQMRKRALHQLFNVESKIFEPLNLKTSSALSELMIEVREIETKIDSLAQNLNLNVKRKDALEYSMLNAFLTELTATNLHKGRNGESLATYEALGADGKKIILAMKTLELGKSGYVHLPVKKIDQTPTYINITEKEFADFKNEQQGENIKIRELNDLINQYLLKTQFANILPAHVVPSNSDSSFLKSTAGEYEACMKSLQNYLKDSGIEMEPDLDKINKMNCVKHPKEWICFAEKAASFRKQTGDHGLLLSHVDSRNYEVDCGLP